MHGCLFTLVSSQSSPGAVPVDTFLLFIVSWQKRHICTQHMLLLKVCHHTLSSILTVWKFLVLSPVSFLCCSYNASHSSYGRSGGSTPRDRDQPWTSFHQGPHGDHRYLQFLSRVVNRSLSVRQNHTVRVCLFAASSTRRSMKVVDISIETTRAAAAATVELVTTRATTDRTTSLTTDPIITTTLATDLQRTTGEQWRNDATWILRRCYFTNVIQVLVFSL